MESGKLLDLDGSSHTCKQSNNNNKTTTAPAPAQLKITLTMEDLDKRLKKLEDLLLAIK